MINLNPIYLTSFLFFCFIHPIIGWIPGADDYFSFLLPLFPLITGISILFIVFSGYNLRTSIDRELIHHQLKRSPQVWSLIRVFIFFMLLDAFKQAFVVRASYFYQWSVIQTILTSLVLILFLSTISTRLVWIAAILCYLCANDIQQFLANSWKLDVVSQGLLNDFQIYSCVLSLVLFIYLCLRIFKSKMLVRNKILTSSLAFSTLLFVIAALFSYTDLNQEDILIVKNFWLGALISDPTSHHGYPLTVWFPIVASGFLLGDILLSVKNFKFTVKIFGVLGFIGLLYLTSEFLLQVQSANFTLMTYTRSILAYDLWGNLLFYMLSLFAFSLFLSTQVQARPNLINKIGSYIVGGMIYIFIFVTGFGQAICSFIQMIFPMPYSHLIATLVLFVFGVGVGFMVDKLLKTKYEFSLVKVKKV